MQKNPIDSKMIGLLLVGGAAVYALIKLLPSEKPDIPNSVDIASYTNTRTGITKKPGEALYCLYGDTIKVGVSFKYFGKAFTAKYHVATYERDLFNSINEVKMVEQTFSVPETSKTATITGEVTMILTENIFEQGDNHFFGIYVKLEGITANIGPYHDSSIYLAHEGEEDAGIVNLKIVSYPTSPVLVGATIPIGINFVYSGPQITRGLVVKLGNDKGIAEFNTMNDTVETIVIPESSNKSISKTVNILVKSATLADGEPYDIRVELGGKYDLKTDVLEVVRQNIEFMEVLEIKYGAFYDGYAHVDERVAHAGDEFWAYIHWRNNGEVPLTVKFMVGMEKTTIHGDSPWNEVSSTLGAREDIVLPVKCQINIPGWSVGTKFKGVAMADGISGLNLPWQKSTEFTIVASTGITNARIDSYTTPVSVGGVCHVVLKFSYKGPAISVPVYVILGNDKVILPPDVMSSVTSQMTIADSPQSMPYEYEVDVPVVSRTTAGGSPYDIIAKINNVLLEQVHDMVVVDAMVLPSIIITTTGSIYIGQLISYEISGFPPSSDVFITLSNSGNAERVTTNVLGNAVGTIYADVVNGTGEHILTATNLSGTIVATTNFIILVTEKVNFSIFLYGEDTDWWAAQYYDPIDNVWIDGGVKEHDADITFSSVHPGGNVAWMYYYYTDQGYWTDWIYTEPFNQIMNYRYYIDFLSGVVT